MCLMKIAGFDGVCFPVSDGLATIRAVIGCESNENTTKTGSPIGKPRYAGPGGVGETFGLRGPSCAYADLTLASDREAGRGLCFMLR